MTKNRAIFPAVSREDCPVVTENIAGSLPVDILENNYALIVAQIALHVSWTLRSNGAEFFRQSFGPNDGDNAITGSPSSSLRNENKLSTGNANRREKIEHLHLYSSCREISITTGERRIM